MTKHLEFGTEMPDITDYQLVAHVDSDQPRSIILRFAKADPKSAAMFELQLFLLDAEIHAADFEMRSISPNSLAMPPLNSWTVHSRAGPGGLRNEIVFQFSSGSMSILYKNLFWTSRTFPVAP